MESTDDFKKLHDQFEKLRAHYAQLGALKTRREKMESETWQAVKKVVADAKKVLGESSGKPASPNASPDNASPSKGDSLEKLSVIANESKQDELEQARKIVEASKQRDDIWREELERLRAVAEVREAEIASLRAEAMVARSLEEKVAEPIVEQRTTVEPMEPIMEELLALRAENRLQRKQIEALEADVALKDEIISRHSRAQNKGSTECDVPTLITTASSPLVSLNTNSPLSSGATTIKSPAATISLGSEVAPSSQEQVTLTGTQWVSNMAKAPGTLHAVQEENPWQSQLPQVIDALHTAETAGSVPSFRANGSENSIQRHNNIAQRPVGVPPDVNPSWTSETPCLKSPVTDIIETAFVGGMQAWDQAARSGLGLCRSVPTLTASARGVAAGGGSLPGSVTIPVKPGQQRSGATARGSPPRAIPYPQRSAAVGTQPAVQVQQGPVTLQSQPVMHTSQLAQLHQRPVQLLQQQPVFQPQQMHQSLSPARLHCGPQHFVFNNQMNLGASTWRSRSTSPAVLPRGPAPVSMTHNTGPAAAPDAAPLEGSFCYDGIAPGSMSIPSMQPMPSMRESEGQSFIDPETVGPTTIGSAGVGSAVVRVGEGVFLNVDE